MAKYKRRKIFDTENEGTKTGGFNPFHTETPPTPVSEPETSPPVIVKESEKIITPSGETIASFDTCSCGHPKKDHGALHGNIPNLGSCNVVNCSCSKYEERK